MSTNPILIGKVLQARYRLDKILGQSIILILTESNQNLLIEKQWTIAAQDSKAIEIEPGVYNYQVIPAQTGAVMEAGRKTWSKEVYRWRVKPKE